jgi:adenylate kinase
LGLLDRQGRPDDQDEEKLRNRYQEYNEKDSSFNGYYKEQGKFHAVNGIGSIDEITLRLVQL